MIASAERFSVRAIDTTGVFFNELERSRFMLLVDERLRGHGGELGDGTISRIAREARRAVFRPPLGSEDAAPLIKVEG